MSFFSALGEELAARRRRLREAIGDRGASLFEFAMLGGLTMSFIAAALWPESRVEGWWPPALLAGLVIGYVALDWRRQRALAQVGETGAEKVSRGHDWLALALCVAMPALGAAAFFLAATEPPPGGETFTPPADAISVDLVP